MKERERVGEKNQAPTYDSIDLNKREKERGTRILIDRQREKIKLIFSILALEAE